MFKTKTVRNLVLVSLAGNALGDIDVYLYIRWFVPMGEAAGSAFAVLNNAGIWFFYLVGFLVGFLYMRPIDLVLAGEASDPAMLDTARRRSLNLPVFVSGGWAFLWAVGAVYFALSLGLLAPEVTAFTVVHITLAVLMGGTITSVFAYFVAGWLSERYLVGPLFDGEPVRSHPGVFRVGIRTKIALFYFTAVVLPLIMTAGSIWAAAREPGGADSPLLLTVVLAGWGIVVGLGLALLISYQICRPVVELEAAMAEIETGDLGARLSVGSADELGRIREGFNQMVQGLKERDFIRETFGRYVTTQVSDAVLNGRVHLGGERREVTILFCDIRNFTAMSEKMTPEEVVGFLNGYFSEVVDVILESGGTLDKFLGDGFLAVYGAPLVQEDHALRAAGAAVKLQQALLRFNTHRRGEGKEPIAIGVSLHSGSVVAGNIGSVKRMEYTVVGDAVNLASRIEGLNRQYGTNILLSSATYERIKEKVEARALGAAEIRGKREPVDVYSLESVAA